ncbi:hypothetical protein [Methylobacterium sp. Gmos1]
MNDAVWTAEATEKAVALWIEGRDPAEIAGEIGTTVADVIGRVAQAALARQQAKAAEKAAAAAKPAVVAKVEPVARIEPVKPEPAKAEPAQAVAEVEPAKAEPAKAGPRILPSRILTADAPVLAKPDVAKPAPVKPAPVKVAKAAPVKPVAAKPETAPVARSAESVAEKPAPKPVVAPPAPRVEAPVMSARALEEATRAFLAANTAPSRKAAPAAKAAPVARPAAVPPATPQPRAVEAPARPVVQEAPRKAPEIAPAPVMAAPVLAEPAEGGSVVALPVSRRVPAVAADGGDGVLFLKAGLLDCTFPLWSDGDGTAIESKRVCGCRVLTGKRWCHTHYATVFEPPKRPMRAA